MIKVIIDRPDQAPEVMGVWDNENLDFAVATANQWADENDMSGPAEDDEHPDDKLQFEWSTIDGTSRIYLVMEEAAEDAEETP